MVCDASNLKYYVIMVCHASNINYYVIMVCHASIIMLLWYAMPQT